MNGRRSFPPIPRGLDAFLTVGLKIEARFQHHLSFPGAAVQYSSALCGYKLSIFVSEVASVLRASGARAEF